MFDFEYHGLLIVLLVVLALLGGAKIPELVRGIKEGIDEFRIGLGGGGPGPSGFADATVEAICGTTERNRNEVRIS